MKKLTITLLIGLLLFGSVPVFALSQKFNDIAENSWYSDAVEKFSDLGIIKGNRNGYFKPHNIQKPINLEQTKKEMNYVI